MKKIVSLLLAGLLASALALPSLAVTEIGATTAAKKVVAEIKGCNKAPTIDGSITGDEYTEIKMDTASMSFNVTDPRKVDEAKAVVWKLYATYDAGFVYIAAVEDVTADLYNCNFLEATKSNIWQQSAMQLGLSPAAAITAASPSTGFIELGYARNSTTGDQLFNIWRDNTKTPIKADATYSKITYANNKLTYEVKVPWTWFQETAGKVGDKIGLCAVIARGIEKAPAASNVTHSSYAGGVTATAKDATFFSTVTLTAAAPVTTTAAPTTAKATTATSTGAAKTADMSAIFVVVMLGAVVTFSIMRKRSSVR